MADFSMNCTGHIIMNVFPQLARRACNCKFFHCKQFALYSIKVSINKLVRVKNQLNIIVVFPLAIYQP